MAQFDVYLNPSKSTQKFYPYILDIQSPLIADLSTRIVIPMGVLAHFGNEKMTRLTPEITYENQKLLLLTPQISSMHEKLLGQPIGSLMHMRDTIIGALDFAITEI